MSLYSILLFIHVLAIALWIGGGFMLALMGARAAKEGPPVPQAVIKNLQFMEWLGPHFYAPVIATTLLSGVWLVVESGIGFEHFFVLTGLAMAFLGAGMGIGFFVPQAKALMAHLNEKGLDAEALARMKTVSLVSRGMLALLVLTVFVMTNKPFS